MREAIFNEKCIISPSLISVCDLCNLEGSVRQLEQAGIEMLHVDILDGHFSPSMPLGLDTVRQLRKKTNMIFDVHLMTTAHDFFVEELLDIGVEQLVFHGEMEPHMDNIPGLKAQQMEHRLHDHAAGHHKNHRTQTDAAAQQNDLVALLRLGNIGNIHHHLIHAYQARNRRAL